MIKTKRFQKNDSGFICTKCGKEVLPNEVTSRDHCPFCLTSLHVDILPGDRENPCRGELVPIRTEPHAKKGFVIHYKCKKCGEKVTNKAALTGVQPDDMDLIIRLTAAVTEDF
ncbi:MAG: RNHCP domain-containing protein [Clostridia bacterium]|nr:RNHCP domain-containing protein [Clostridia bacterium]